MTFDFSANGKVTVHSDHTEDWRVTVVDTGLNTMTGGRLKRVKDYISGEPFLMTYGDGVADVDINECIRFHEETGTIDRKSTRLNSSHDRQSRMPSSA